MAGIIARFVRLQRPFYTSSIIRRPVIKFHAFSTGSKGNDNNNDNPPDSFWDDAVEKEREILDIAAVVGSGKSVRAMNSVKRNHSWKDVHKMSKYSLLLPEEMDQENLEMSDDELIEKEAESMQTVQDTDDHNKITKEQKKNIAKERLNGSDIDYDSLKSSQFPLDDLEVENVDSKVPLFKNEELPSQKDIDELVTREQGMEVTNLNTAGDEEVVYPDDSLESYLPNTNPDKFTSEQQNKRHCPGKKQRRGKMEAKLYCHLIDLDKLSFMDVSNLSRFLSINGEILPKKVTGLCSKCQRKVSKTIKCSRSIGLLPHIGNVSIVDAKPLNTREIFHRSKDNINKISMNKSIL